MLQGVLRLVRLGLSLVLPAGVLMRPIGPRSRDRLLLAVVVLPRIKVALLAASQPILVLLHLHGHLGVVSVFFGIDTGAVVGVERDTFLELAVAVLLAELGLLVPDYLLDELVVRIMVELPDILHQRRVVHRVFAGHD